MFQDTSAIEYKYQLFVDRVVKALTVWTLKSNEGFATCESNEYEAVEVIPFWSDQADAEALAKDEWESFLPHSMHLSEFLEDWIAGMNSEGLLVGTNWDQDLFGKEVEPLDLALEISTKLIQQNKAIVFKKYKDISDYHNQIRKALGIEK
jgi:hypothetical protein